MLRKIKHLLGILLFAKPLKKTGPFERAAAEVAEMEGRDRARWEERERRWHAKSRAVHGPKAWNMDPGVPAPRLSVEKNGREEREKASGIVIDPGGTCLCRRCGHTVSALHDNCINCYSKLNWNA